MVLAQGLIDYEESTTGVQGEMEALILILRKGDLCKAKIGMLEGNILIFPALGGHFHFLYL